MILPQDSKRNWNVVTVRFISLGTSCHYKSKESVKTNTSEERPQSPLDGHCPAERQAGLETCPTLLRKAT